MKLLKTTSLKADNNPIPMLSVIAMIGFAVFLCTTFILHFLQPDYDASNRFVSEFILGQYGWLLNLGFVGNLFGCGAFTLAYYHFQKHQKSPVVLICLCVTTLSVLTNFFPTDIHGKAVTISGHIHNIGAFIGTLAFFPVMAIFPYQIKKLGMLKGFYVLLVLLAILAPVSFILLIAIVNIAPDFLGISQRIFALIVMLWLILAALRLKTGSFVEA